MSNHLQGESSPYLLQHADNPVDWHPWGADAFERARAEDKPIFLSIGYSTCHWCHVMAHESFEDEEVAALLNRHFISIKVDREERPDIDSIYMAVCQAFTDSGGWPTSLFLTPDQQPFFAGTYFPATTRGGMIGLRELLAVIHEKWHTDRETLLQEAGRIVDLLRDPPAAEERASEALLDTAVALYKRSFDRKYGGFGRAPKFPTPHNLLFLLAYHERHGDAVCLEMAERTLYQMYRGGLFDHIGYGFCRYSTDKQFLVPHFEKMLYDNALLILTYTRAYTVTKNALYLEVAQKTAAYVLREMTSPDGGFYSAQDADCDGEEGKFYLVTPSDILSQLGDELGEAFCRYFGITERGNFEGKNIPNLLAHGYTDASFERCMPKLVRFRHERLPLHLDDKILTAWNGLMIAALCALYRTSGEAAYLTAAQNADRFLAEHLTDGERLFVSFRDGKRGVGGFLDDYASVIFAQLALYDATLSDAYLARAVRLCDTVLAEFADEMNGGFYLYGANSEALIVRPKETHDGAIPSGNSLMAWNLVRLALLTDEERFDRAAARQLDFMAGDATAYPSGYAMYLCALLDHLDPPPKVTVVAPSPHEVVALSLPPRAVVLWRAPSDPMPLKDGKTTFYICHGHRCSPPTNDWHDVL